MAFKLSIFARSRQVLGASHIGVPVIDTNTLRQAALQNSWQRDQRVARRRLAFRWAMWWLWKYRYYVLAVCAVLVCLGYLVYRFDQASRANHSLGNTPVAAPEHQTDLHLRIESHMLPATDSGASSATPPDASPPTATDPFQLKPETTLKTKVTNP